MVTMAPLDEQFFTVEEVARALRVSDDTIHRWIRSGKIAAIQPSGWRGRYRIAESQVRRLRSTPARAL